MRRMTVVLLSTYLSTTPVHAGIESELRGMEGWCVVAVKTIDGYVDDEGKRHDDFEGCDFDRKIIFRDGTYLTCGGYGYQYAYSPDAIIFATSFNYKGKKHTSFKMLVEGDMYDMHQ